MSPFFKGYKNTVMYFHLNTLPLTYVYPREPKLHCEALATFLKHPQQ